MGRSHKETNTYRFQNFTERMKFMHIDVVHQIRKRTDEDDGEDSTLFGNALSKWVDLNCTQSFDDFKDDMSKYPCTTYVQLVHHAEAIVAVLKKHLLVEKTLALEPLLDLVVQMARDIGPDFYVHFHEVFEILVQLLKSNSKDSDTLEKVFVTMAYLYKFMWRYLVKDINTVYGYFSSLLTENNKEYIQRFAAESFAYLMRKVKDHNALLEFLFMDLEQFPEKTEGVGQLLFEMMKGVGQHFHSVSGEVFHSILLKLGPLESKEKGQLPVALVEETVSRLMTACAEHSKKELAGHLWTTLLDMVTAVKKCCPTEKKGKTSPEMSQHILHLSRLLRLANIWVTHANGKFVSDPSSVAKVVSDIITELPVVIDGDSFPADLLTLTSSLLLHCSDHLSVEHTARLVSKVFSADFKLENVYRQFALPLIQSPLFEKDVLPGLLSFMWNQFDQASPVTQRDMVSLLAEVVLQKAPVPECGDELSSLQLYPLDFARARKGVKSGFVQYMQQMTQPAIGKTLELSGTDQLSEIFAALVCLPHINTVDPSVNAKTIATAFDCLKKVLSEHTSNAIQDQVLYVIHQAIVSLMVVQANSTILDFLPFEEVFNLLKTHPSNCLVLHAADLYLTLMSDLGKNDLLSYDLLLELYPVLEPNLVSWRHKVRLSTLHIFTLFPVKNQNEEEAHNTIFTASLAAEQVPLTVRDYRKRLMHLRKLEHSIVHAIMPVGPFSKMPVLYLMGSLTCPMTLMWDPVCDLIASHARGMEREDFWEPFSHWLTVAAKKAAASCTETSTINTETLLGQWLSKKLSSDRFPDYHSFRNSLWKAMSLFPEKCEHKSREIVPLFLNFLQNEYYKTDLSVAPSENICQAGESDGEDDVDPDDTVADEDDEEDEERETLVKEDKVSVKAAGAAGSKAGQKLRKSAVQSLLAHLEVFSKMRNPRSLYKETELRDIYFQFLEHKHSKVQTVTFRCIMTYKYKFLVPYRENFERLLDDKTFKTEVVLFSVDEESTVIDSKHRAELLPFLMRILYGKMLSKAGTETSGKRRADVRRSIVFRFLAGCSSAEMQYFLDLVFGTFKDFVTDDPLKMVRERFAVDIKNVVPPKQMKGVLGAVVVVTQKLGNLLYQNARSILHLVLGIAATCAACLQHRASLKSSAVTMLKSVRQMAFRRLIEFFGEFDQFEYSKQEQDAILEAFVWPQLDMLSLESRNEPSLLLKLIQCWCQDPKYFFLLTQKAPKGDNSALHAMFTLLASPGVGRPVSFIILKALESLVEGEEDVEEPTPKRRKIVNTQTESQGVLLVKPHVPALLTFIEESVRTLGGQLQKTKQGVASKETLLELKILAKVSVYIEDEAQSLRLCSLLMPFLSGSITLRQDLEESTLESVLNLMKTVRDPRPFFRPVVPLFNGIERRHSRIFLCQILKVIGSKVPELEEISEIVEKLNAWNPRQVEEPDYGVRLETFSSVLHKMKEWTEVNVDFMLALAYNCFFFIRTFDDLSLRDNSTLCVVTLVQRFKDLTSDSKLYKDVIAGIVLPHMKKGLRSKQQSVRHEFLAVLQALVVAFPEHKEFVGLSGLHDTDIESDFFENIRHIQIHKQAKALRRLSHYMHSHKLRADQLMGFVLPLLYAYILDKQYNKSGKILDAAVDLTCMMCRQLPWQNYYQLLRLFLSHLPRHLDNQRTIIKVIVAILDGFHFDLSQSNFKFSNKPKLNKNSEEEAMEADSEEKTLEEKLAEEAEEALPSMETMTSNSESTETEEGYNTTPLVFSADRKDLCAPGLATRIHSMVLNSLIPQLHKTLTEKMKCDEAHKLAHVKYAEDEEILRVPIAMAMIKLLQKLPDGALNHKLPGIVFRVCNFLKSRSQDIRMTARDTLVKTVQTIGPRYLPFIFKEMRSSLTRGYQMHVLCFSVYHVLKSITSMLKPGDLDPALSELQEIYQEELFGAVSEEKTVDGITSKLFEAKTIKGYLAYKIMAQFISEDFVGTLVHPLKTVLEGTYSQRVANKVRMALQSINTGLIANTSMTTRMLMLFVHSLTADNLPSLRPVTKPIVSESSGLEKPKRPESCLLLPKAAPRGGHKPKSHKESTLDVLVEFGLLLLHSCLKSPTMLQSTNTEHLGFLEPLVPTLVECLSLKYVKVNSAVLRCFEHLLTYPLPTLKKKMKAVARQLFVLLKNYATAGAAKGDNQELVLTCFKTVTVLVRDVKYHKLNTEHLQVLLTYCEEDIHDHSRQSTAFSVIKAILKRRLDVPELHELISTIETISITAETSVKTQCREVILQYLKDYPLGKKMETHFAFFIKQLSYEFEEGRLSTLRILRAIFSSLAEEILQRYAGLFFLPMATCMFADEAQSCRELALSGVKTLLERIDIETRDVLFSWVLNWLSDEKMTLCCVATQLCGLFVEVESVNFTVHRKDFFPALLERDISTASESEEDQFCFMLMVLIKKLVKVIDVKTLSSWTDINKLLDCVQTRLLHNHTWVRLITCEIMGYFFSSVGQEDVRTYLSVEQAKQLMQTLIIQLQSPLLDEELGLQILKNMAFLVQAYHSESDENEGIPLTWSVRKMIREANFERVKNPQVKIKRDLAFKWVAFVSQEFKEDAVKTILEIVVPALLREAEDIGKEETLKELAKETMERLRKKAGVEAFSEVYANAVKFKQQVKEKRKQKRAIAAVNNPEIAAAKRMKKNRKRKRVVTDDRKRRIKKTKLTVHEHKDQN